MKTVKHIAHVIYATAAIHASVLASERMKDAYADVGLDHGVQLIERVLHSGDAQ